MASSKISLKLLIDTKSQTVLFAEAGKDFVDFLFYLLSLPVGTVVKLVRNKNMVGCLGQLYQSIETLHETYIQPNHQNKDLLLNPRSPICDLRIPLMLSDNASKNQKFYTCDHSSYGRHFYVADAPNVSCPSCNSSMKTAMTYVSPAAAKTGTAAAAERGFVKELVTYMIMDNLEVTPMSTISCITLLNKFNDKDVGKLEEQIVDFGVDEGLKLLKASMECKTVLTSTFLRKMEE